MVNTTGHLTGPNFVARIKKLGKSRLFWVIVGIIVLLALIVGVGLWGLHNTRQTHRQAISQWLSSYDQAYKKATEQLAQEKAAPEPSIQSLQQFNAALSNWKLPAEPSFGSLSLLPSELRTAQTAVTKNKEQLQKQLQATTELVQHQAATIALLHGLSNKKTSNLEELKALATEWNAKAEELKIMHVPGPAKDFHNSLLAAVNEVTPQLQALIPLFEKQDVAGFQAKQQEVVAKVGAIQAHSEQWQAITKAADLKLAHELQHLQQALLQFRHYIK